MSRIYTVLLPDHLKPAAAEERAIVAVRSVKPLLNLRHLEAAVDKSAAGGFRLVRVRVSQ